MCGTAPELAGRPGGGASVAQVVVAGMPAKKSRSPRDLAVEAAFAEVLQPLVHCRVALGGLASVVLVRVLASQNGVVPGAMSGAHCIAATSDVLSLLCGWPFFRQAWVRKCMRTGALGLVLSTLFGMFLSVLSVVCMYLAVATPRPLAMGRRPLLDVLEATLGAWDLVLLASVCLHLSLCVSAWRVYKALHRGSLLARLAPSALDGSTSAEVGQQSEALQAALAVEELSLGEFLCETNVVLPEELCDCQADRDLSPRPGGDGPTRHGAADLAKEEVVASARYSSTGLGVVEP